METYVSVVPRLLPSQYLSKRIPLSDDQNEYFDQNRSIPLTVSPQANSNQFGPLATRTQLNNKNVNQQGDLFSNHFKTKISPSRLHHEPLKDNSFYDQPPRNSLDGYQYPFQQDQFLVQQQNHPPLNRSTIIILFIFGLIISFFSLAALAISIYLLVRITNSSNISG